MSIKSAVRATVPRKVRNWLRSPSKTIQWAWDSARYSLGTRITLPLFPTWSIVCHPQAYRAIHSAQVADPEQREEFEHFVAFCDSSMFLFDIGAHFGVFSLAAAHFGGRAVAVDPSPTATRMIAREAALNECGDRIQIVRAAVSDVSGRMELLEAGVFTYGYYRVDKGRARTELTQVRAMTVDEMTSRFGVPTHIKVDVEGHEAPVLRGARATLSKWRPVLFLELHNEMVRHNDGDPDWVFDELDRAHYRIFSTNGGTTDRESILRWPIARIVAKPAGCP